MATDERKFEMMSGLILGKHGIDGDKSQQFEAQQDCKQSASETVRKIRSAVDGKREVGDEQGLNTRIKSITAT